MLFGPAIAVCQEPAPRDSLAAQIASLNAEISQRAFSTQEPARLAEALKARAALLGKVMAADPLKLAELALPQNIAARLRTSAPEDTVERQGQWTGTLGKVVADDFSHHRSETRWMLHTAGRNYDIVSPEIPGWRSGSAVKVSGTALGGRLAVHTLEVDGTGSGSPAPACTTTGVQNIAVLFVTTPSYPTVEPGLMDRIRQYYFGDPAQSPGNMTLNGWWNEMAHGQISATGSVFGPFALSQDYGEDQSSDVLTAALAAADSTVDFSAFSRVQIVFQPASSGGSDYAGMSSVGCINLNTSTKAFTASWEILLFRPDVSPIDLHAIVHELGHGLGLNHSNTEQFGDVPLGPLNVDTGSWEYEDYTTAMGLYGGQFGAEHSALLKWLHPGDYLDVSTSGTYTLAPFETNGLRALRILRDPLSGAALWVEYRQPIGDVDGAILDSTPGSNVFAGALIRYADPNLDDPRHTYLLDFGPPGDSFVHPTLTPGKSWSDPYTPLTLKVNSATSQGLSITVAYDTPCATAQLSATSFPSTGGTGTLTITAPATCAWTVSAGSNWIAFAGAASGAGNASLAFTVAANESGQSRTASITIARQSVLVYQSSGQMIVEGMTPQSGTGASGQLTFRFSDFAGVADLSYVEISFANGCLVLVTPYDDQVNFGSASMYLGTPGASITAGACTIFSDGSSITTTANEVVVTLNVSFATQSNEPVSISARAHGWQGGITPRTWVGQWTIPSASAHCAVVLAPVGQILSPAGGMGQFDVTAPPGCAWTAQSTAAWLTLFPSSAAGSGSGTVDFIVAANSANAPRNGYVMAGGEAFPVRQGGGLPTISVVAGGALPATPGPAARAAIPMMTGIVSDSAGDIYVSSEQWNAVFRVRAEGIVTRVAGTFGLGDTDQEGPALAARLNEPHGLAIDAAGNLYIGDSPYHLVRRVSRNGIITTVVGGASVGSLGDNGPAMRATLNYPGGLTVDSSGNLFIVDTWDARVRKVDEAGTITTVAGNGVAGYSGDGGPATGAQINQATAIAVDAAGNLYIADTGNQRIRKVSTTGTITTFAGNGTAGYSGDGGRAAIASLNSPGGVALDAAGNLYVADMSNNRIRMVNQRGIIGTVAGNGTAGFAGDKGAATSAALNAPNGVTFDRSGTLYIADRGNQRIRSVAGGIIRTFAGEFHGDGAPAVFAHLIAPSAVTQDKRGNLYAADSGGNSVRKIAPDGTITTLAGTGSAGLAGDGGPAIAAELNQPGGIAVDASGAVFIADTGNNRIRRVSTGGTITTVQGGDGTADDERLAAPRGLFFETSGGLLIADSGNGLVRRMETSGTVTTIAGNRDSVPIGDGDPATAAKLGAPWAVAEDSLGNLYIADNLWNRIRKVDARGTITTVVPPDFGGPGDSGLGLLNLSGVAVDSLGNLYFSDENHQRIWVLNRAGVFNWLAGGSSNYEGTIEGADPAQSAIGSPTGLFLGRSGNLYFGDSHFGTIQVLTPGGSQPVLALESAHGDMSTSASGSYDITVSNSTYAGPTSGTVTFLAVPTAGLNLVSLSGVGWACSGNRCTRGDALAGGSSYPPVTAEVSVESSAGDQATVQFSVSGGGAVPTGINDFTGLRVLRPPRVRPVPVPHGH